MRREHWLLTGVVLPDLYTPYGRILDRSEAYGAGPPIPAPAGNHVTAPRDPVASRGRDRGRVGLLNTRSTAATLSLLRELYHFLSLSTFFYFSNM